jgi:hypothetical protein
MREVFFRKGAKGKWAKSNSEGVQELLFGPFLQTEIPESLKYDTFVGEVRLYTIHAILSA